MTILLAALLLSLNMPGAHAAIHESSIGVEFPDRIGPLTLMEREELPRKELGVNFAYGHDGPVRASLFVYTGGLTSIPDGTESATVRRHFTQVINEVKQMQAMGRLRSIDFPPGKEGVTAHAGCGPQFLWKEYVMELTSGTRLTSFTYLTALQGHFVKLRFSYRQEDTQARDVLEEFLPELRKVLGRCGK